MRYRGPPAGAVRAVPLDAVTALYHRPSGTTHLVVSPVPELLELLGPDWTDLAALHARAAAAFALEGAADALAARLDELVEAGLVERA